MAEQTILIGLRIRQARLEAGLTQAELAAKVPGKSDGTQMSKWERGLHRPSDDTLEHIARILERDVAWFHVSEPDKSATPDLLSELSPDVDTRLRKIEEQQTEIKQAVDRLLEETNRRPSPEQDALMLRFFEEWATRMGRDQAGKHDLERRKQAIERAAGHRLPPSEAVA